MPGGPAYRRKTDRIQIPSEIRAAPSRIKAPGSVKLNRAGVCVTSATTHNTATKSATVLVMRHLFRIPSEIRAAPIRIKALGSVRLNRVSPRRSMLAATGVTSATTHSTAIDKSTAVLVMRHLLRCFDGSINGEKPSAYRARHMPTKLPMLGETAIGGRPTYGGPPTGAFREREQYCRGLRASNPSADDQL